MAKLKLFLGVLIAISVMIVGWWISSENSQLVSPVLFGYDLPSWNLGAWMFLMLLIGGLLGYVISLLSYVKHRGKAMNLQRKLSSRDQELAKMRASSMKD